MARTIRLTEAQYAALFAFLKMSEESGDIWEQYSEWSEDEDTTTPDEQRDSPKYESPMLTALVGARRAFDEAPEEAE